MEVKIEAALATPSRRHDHSFNTYQSLTEVKEVEDPDWRSGDSVAQPVGDNCYRIRRLARILTLASVGSALISR
jgi:hypothetical protein